MERGPAIGVVKLIYAKTQRCNRKRLHVVTSRLMGAIRSRDRLEK